MYLVRLFGIPFGIHSILLIILLFLALSWIRRGDFSLCLLASLLSLLALAIFEFVSLSLLMSVFNVTPESLFADPIRRIILGEPQVILLFITAFILNNSIRKGADK